MNWEDETTHLYRCECGYKTTCPLEMLKHVRTQHWHEDIAILRSRGSQCFDCIWENVVPYKIALRLVEDGEQWFRSAVLTEGVELML